jgi:hypothetical protein
VVHEQDERAADGYGSSRCRFCKAAIDIQHESLDDDESLHVAQLLSSSRSYTIWRAPGSDCNWSIVSAELSWAIMGRFQPFVLHKSLWNMSSKSDYARQVPVSLTLRHRNGAIELATSDGNEVICCNILCLRHLQTRAVSTVLNESKSNPSDFACPDITVLVAAAVWRKPAHRCPLRPPPLLHPSIVRKSRRLHRGAAALIPTRGGTHGANCLHSSLAPT